MMKHWAIAASAAALAVTWSAPDAAAQKSKDTLRVAWQYTVENVDNYFNTNREGILFSRMVWDTLVDRDPKTFKTIPNLATSWKWADDRTLEMELRQGVKFHNGEEFDADDVVFTLNFISNPENKVINQSNVNWIEKAEKVDKFKVRIITKKPFPAALEFLTIPIVMYPNEYYAKVGPKEMGLKPIGTGPYKVTKIEPAKEYTLERWEGHFEGGSKPHAKIKNIVIRTIPEMSTQIAELLAGGIDWAWYVPTDQADRLERVPSLKVDRSETMRTGYIGFDASNRTSNKAINDVRVRQAIAHAIDRDAIIKNLIGGASRKIHAPCFPTQFGCDDSVATKYEYDPAKAKKLLADAGYANGFDLDFYAYRPRDWAEAIMGYLTAVGIRPKLQHMTYIAVRDKNHEGVTPMYFMDWGSYSINDVSALLPNFFGGSPDDFARDADVQKWLAAGGSTVDEKVRKENYSNAIKRITERAYWLPMFSFVTNYAYTKDLDFTPFADELPRYYLYGWK